VFLIIIVNTTSTIKAVYLWNGSSYCSDSTFILILVACTFATSHKLEIAFLSDKGPFLRACHIYYIGYGGRG